MNPHQGHLLHQLQFLLWNLIPRLKLSTYIILGFA